MTLPLVWKKIIFLPIYHAHKSEVTVIVGKKRDLRIEDPGFFWTKLGKILKIRKKYENQENIRKMLQKLGKYSEKYSPKNRIPEAKSLFQTMVTVTQFWEGHRMVQTYCCLGEPTRIHLRCKSCLPPYPVRKRMLFYISKSQFFTELKSLYELFILQHLFQLIALVNHIGRILENYVLDSPQISDIWLFGYLARSAEHDQVGNP